MGIKNSIYFLATVAITMALSMLVLVSGIRLVGILAPYYATRSEMWLAIGATIYASLLVDNKVPEKVMNWLRKDENFY